MIRSAAEEYEDEELREFIVVVKDERADVLSYMQ